MTAAGGGPSDVAGAGDGATIDLREIPAVSVVVIDDHALLAESIVRALRAEGFVSSTVPPTSRDAVLELVLQLAPRVALVDLDLGSPSFSGLDLIGPLIGGGSEVVVLTSWDDRLLNAASLEEGAVGIVSKYEPFAAVVEAVQRAADGVPFTDRMEREALRQELRRRRVEHARQLAPFGRLSARECSVLEDLIAGRAADVIATASFVSIATVRSQIQSVLQKLDVNSQLAAVATARRCGWSTRTPPSMARYSATLHL